MRKFPTTQIIRFLSQSIPKGNTKLFRFQEQLPRLPVPDLKETLSKYATSLIPIADSQEELENSQKRIAEFIQDPATSVGFKLQDLLLQKAQAKSKDSSWLEEWWNNLGYLEYRDPVALWVNYGFLLKDEENVIQSDSPKSNPQSSRAARLVYSALKFKHLVESEELEPDMIKETPLCCYQYPFLFNSSRIPRNKRDEMKSFPGSKHIVVARSNRFYIFDLYDSNGLPKSPADIEQSILKIIEMDDNDSSIAPPVGIFTADHRDSWAKNYTLLESDPNNKKSLELIHSAVMMLCLDKVSLTALHKLSEQLLHSDAKNRWFDKQIQLIVNTDGKAGFNYEHARIDGLTTLRLSNFMQQDSSKVQFGKSTGIASAPTKLEWNITPDIRNSLDVTSKTVADMIANNQTETINFTAFGNKGIKGLKFSPDAFFQVALQLAYYRLNEKSAATYESASTREFYHGRTETIRSATQSSNLLCKALERNTNVSVVEKKKLLSDAVEAHNTYAKEAKNGKGVDRHLFGLRMLAKENGFEMPSIFTDPLYSKSCHWILSTSNCGSSSLRLFTFGPVVPDGYGVGYMIHEDQISVNITAKKDCKSTSARLLANSLEHALMELPSISLGIQPKL